MRCPTGMGAEARRAWSAARAGLPPGQPVERFEDALRRYGRTVDLAARLRAEWRALGEPVTAQGGATGQALVPHPLVKMLGEAERDAARFGAVLGLDPQSRRQLGAQAGRPQEQVPPRGASEPARARDRLRAVGS